MERATVDELPSTAALVGAYGLYDSDRKYTHILEASTAGVSCACDRCARWDAFVRNSRSYVLPTLDLVDGVATWLCSLHAAEAPMLHADAAPMRVLEVGAGNGKLAAHLQRALRAVAPAVKYTATDVAACADDSVQQLDAHAAIAATSPDVIVCAAMPLGVDWTAAFRACASVSVYLLLGEADNGCCGRPWQTWGVLHDDDSDADIAVSSTSSDTEDEGASDDGERQSSSLQPPGAAGLDVGLERWRQVYRFEPSKTPWGAQGWRREELDALSRHVVCMTDSCWDATRHGRAVAFVRGARPAAVGASAELRAEPKSS